MQWSVAFDKLMFLFAFVKNRLRAQASYSEDWH